MSKKEAKTAQTKHRDDPFTVAISCDHCQRLLTRIKIRFGVAPVFVLCEICEIIYRIEATSRHEALMRTIKLADLNEASVDEIIASVKDRLRKARLLNPELFPTSWQLSNDVEVLLIKWRKQ